MTWAPPRDRLAELLGPVAARTLQDTFLLRNREVRLAVPEWTASGNTGARLVAITIQDRSDRHSKQAHKCVVKVCPPGPLARESARHHETIKNSPPSFVRDHLVDIAFEPVLCPDGTVLLGQAIAGGSLLRCQPLSTLPADELVDVCRAVVSGVLVDWTGEDYGTSRQVSVADVLRMELRESFTEGGPIHAWAAAAGLLDPRAAWIRTTEDGVMPNPVLMATEHSDGSRCPLQYLTGRAHGDLHDDNVLVPRPHDGLPRPELFRLIDLATFDRDAPLSRDPAMLLLATVSHSVGGLPAAQQHALLEYLVTATGQVRSDLTRRTVDLVDAIRDVRATPFVRRGFQDEWDLQFLVSMQAAALLHSSFDNLGKLGRWWCLRLAGLIGKQILVRYGQYQPKSPFDVGPQILTVEPLAGTAQPSRSQAGTMTRDAVGAPAVIARERPLAMGRPPTLSLAQRTFVVERLLSIPKMNEPSFRQRIYEDLPNAVVSQLHRDSVSRLEIFDLVRVFLEYWRFEPWRELVAVLHARLPHLPAVDALVTALVEIDLIKEEDASGI